MTAQRCTPWRRLPLGVCLAVAIVLALAAFPSTSPAAIAWGPCPLAGYQCAQVDVPLDRSGAVPGTVSLAVSRVPAATNPNHSAVVPLAGGPGQAALGLAEDFAQSLKPAIADRDLLVFDQRGTGLSGALDCNGLRDAATLAAASGACSAELGPGRAFYRTADSVEDIEALRIAGGYDKLVLYGVSYGTKVAMAYASAHPDHVEALVLDSVVLPEGPDPLQLSTLHSIRRVLGDLCHARACAAATPDVNGDLRRLAARLRTHPLRGRVVDADGRLRRDAMGERDLFNVLLAGDLNPMLRAELPGAMRAAMRGDGAPLLRLGVRSSGLTTGRGTLGADSDTLFLTTTCEETPFPWTRGAPVAQRREEATAAADRVPTSRLGPFSSRVALLGGAIPYCLDWTTASPAPVPAGPLPRVPILVLAGQMDLRTPYEDAVKLAARVPGTQVVEIPYTGHSTVGSDESGCARRAMARFFAGRPAGRCARTANHYKPTPQPPSSFAAVAAQGASGREGRTLGAVRRTLRDAIRQVAGETLAQGTIPESIGGLRAGTVSATSSGLVLHRYEYVPGVVVSGSITRNAVGTVTVHGGGAEVGSLRLGGDGAVSGRLDGRTIAVGGH